MYHLYQHSDKYRGFVPVKNVLKNFSNKPSLKLAFSRQTVIQAWANAAGVFLDAAGEQTKALDYRNGTLWVACLSKETAYEIKILSVRIIAELNQRLGRRLVYSLALEN